MNEATSSKETIDLQLIELFLTIAKSKSIAAAARQFHMSPSLATRRLAALERTLQVRLFQRTTRALHLTEAGRNTLQWAEQVLDSYTHLRDDLSWQDQAPEGLIRLAVSDYVASVLLPAFLQGFMKRYPKISYRITTTDHLVNPVEHEFDVAVHSGFMPDSSLIGIPLRPVQRILSASPAYLEQAGTPQTPAELRRHVCLSHGASEQFEWFFERDGAIAGQKIDPALSIDSYLALLQFALNGLGIVRISYNVVKDPIRSGALVQVLPDWRCVPPKGELASMWMIYPNRKLPYRVRTLVTELQQYLETTLGRPAQEPGQALTLA